MRQGKARRLYEREWRAYQDGFIDGTSRKLIVYPDETPAFAAGYEQARANLPCPRQLPLDVWTRCVACDSYPQYPRYSL